MSLNLPPDGRDGWVGAEGALLVLSSGEVRKLEVPLRESMRGETDPQIIFLGSGSQG